MRRGFRCVFFFFSTNLGISFVEQANIYSTEPHKFKQTTKRASFDHFESKTTSSQPHCSVLGPPNQALQFVRSYRSYLSLSVRLPVDCACNYLIAQMIYDDSLSVGLKPRSLGESAIVTNRYRANKF
uniref:Putative secreted protein n=1 Tax=Anopheles triannulatus TaxID=58253 RepID=A0A2M4B200_9DIPT